MGSQVWTTASNTVENNRIDQFVCCATRLLKGQTEKKF